MSNCYYLSCPKCKVFREIGHDGTIYDPEGGQIGSFICDHRACGPTLLSDDYTDPDPIEGDEWREA